MKNLLIAVAIVTSSSATSFGQDIKVVPFQNFFEKLEVVKNGADIDVVRDGRAIHVKTVVEVPAGSLHLKLSYMLGDEGGRSVHLIVTDFKKTISIRNTDDVVLEKTATIRLMFSCTSADEVVCRRNAQDLLAQSTQVQSLGAPNIEDISVAPEKDLIFTFLLNSSGKFRI